MALKPRKRTALTEEQVIQIRKLYYLEEYSYTQLAEQFETTRRVMQCAVQGIGKYYADIQDTIPEDIKQNRIPAREKYSLASSMRYQAKATKTVQTRTGSTVKLPSYESYKAGWTEEQIKAHEQGEQERYKRAREFGF